VSRWGSEAYWRSPTIKAVLHRYSYVSASQWALLLTLLLIIRKFLHTIGSPWEEGYIYSPPIQVFKSSLLLRVHRSPTTAFHLAGEIS